MIHTISKKFVEEVKSIKYAGKVKDSNRNENIADNVNLINLKAEISNIE